MRLSLRLREPLRDLSFDQVERVQPGDRPRSSKGFDVRTQRGPNTRGQEFLQFLRKFIDGRNLKFPDRFSGWLKDESVHFLKWRFVELSAPHYTAASVKRLITRSCFRATFHP
ncbi:MAG: hypothetical protein QM757_36280 [Paludibaculum sp.]